MITREQFTEARNAQPFRVFWIYTPAANAPFLIMNPDRISRDFECEQLAIHTPSRFFLIPTATAELVYDDESRPDLLTPHRFTIEEYERMMDLPVPHCYHPVLLGGIITCKETGKNYKFNQEEYDLLVAAKIIDPARVGLADGVIFDRESGHKARVRASAKKMAFIHRAALKELADHVPNTTDGEPAGRGNTTPTPEQQARFDAIHAKNQTPENRDEEARVRSLPRERP